MSRFNPGPLIGWAAALLAAAAAGSFPAAFAEEIPLGEVSGFYTSFASNVGGLPEYGARYRSGHFETELMSLSGSLALELGYTYRFNVNSFFVPRVILGAAYAFGTLAAAPALDFTFPLISVGSRKYVGLSLDTYFYLYSVRSKVQLTPVIPLCVSFIF
jgi:hypothetical protein